jgi:predicted AAA+ superfamily ATPase
MKRNLYHKLLDWKKSKNRKPLVLRGARQVGKTYLLKTFGKNEYQHCLYLNFEENPQLAGFFSEKLDPNRILENLRIYLDNLIHAKDCFIIFDEIQECPEALNSLKYFQEQAPEFHIAAAGSLLGVKLSQTKGFPVGKVNFYDLYPLSFFEFLEALDKKKLRDFLEELKTLKPVAEPIHHELIGWLKKYLVIGGMPEAVATYQENNDFSKVRQVQNEILQAYVLDFAKHAPPQQVMNITKIWESIPNHLAKENKKFVFSAVRKGARARDYESAIQWLADAGLIYKVYNISTPKLPLAAYSDKNIFKVFLIDAGLLTAMSKVPPQAILDKHALFSEFNGAFTENFVTEELIPLYGDLYYWTSEGTAEVDFVVQKGTEILPLEVKADVSKKKKSLLVYGEKYKTPILSRASLMNLHHSGNIANYPLYLASLFPLNNSEKN